MIFHGLYHGGSLIGLAGIYVHLGHGELLLVGRFFDTRQYALCFIGAGAGFAVIFDRLIRLTFGNGRVKDDAHVARELLFHFIQRAQGFTAQQAIFFALLRAEIVLSSLNKLLVGI